MIGITIGIGHNQRGESVQRVENNTPPQSPSFSYLALNGTSDKLVTPSITFDEIEIDFKSKIMNSGSIRYYFDARTSASMCFYSSGDTGPENFSGGTSMTKNGVVVSSGTEFINTANEERATYALKGTAQTSIVHFGVRYTLIQFAKMDIYSIKLKSAGIIVAHYDMTKGNVQDQSGNGNHATLTGGTWV